MVTIKAVNAALQKLDPTAELMRGDGYLYFAGESVERCKTTMVMVARLNSLTLDQWIAEFKALQQEQASR